MRNFIDIFENNDSAHLIEQIITGRLESFGRSGIDPNSAQNAALTIASLDNPSRDAIVTIVEKIDSLDPSYGLDPTSIANTVQGICDLIGIS